MQEVPLTSRKPEHAARAHERAHEVIAAARAAKEHSEQIRTERCLRRRRARPQPPEVEGDTEATLRTLLGMRSPQ